MRRHDTKRRPPVRLCACAQARMRTPSVRLPAKGPGTRLRGWTNQRIQLARCSACGLHQGWCERDEASTLGGRVQLQPCQAGRAFAKATAQWVGATCGVGRLQHESPLQARLTLLWSAQTEVCTPAHDTPAHDCEARVPCKQKACQQKAQGHERTKAPCFPCPALVYPLHAPTPCA